MQKKEFIHVRNLVSRVRHNCSLFTSVQSQSLQGFVKSVHLSCPEKRIFFIQRSLSHVRRLRYFLQYLMPCMRQPVFSFRSRKTSPFVRITAGVK